VSRQQLAEDGLVGLEPIEQRRLYVAGRFPILAMLLPVISEGFKEDRIQHPDRRSPAQCEDALIGSQPRNRFTPLLLR
jgi:hypothetical protein